MDRRHEEKDIEEKGTDGEENGRGWAIKINRKEKWATGGLTHHIRYKINSSLTISWRFVLRAWYHWLSQTGSTMYKRFFANYTRLPSKQYTCSCYENTKIENTRASKIKFPKIYLLSILFIKLKKQFVLTNL